MNEDVSLGSWFLGLDVEHVDDRRLCCGTTGKKNSSSLIYVQVWKFSRFHLLINEKLQIVSGRRRRATSVLPRSIGAAVGFVDQRIG